MLALILLHKPLRLPQLVAAMTGARSPLLLAS